MASLNSIFNFLTSNILTRAELFVGLIILLGYILQRNNGMNVWEDFSRV
ncbi:MAG: hypothetical protein ACLVHS_17355 [Blautia wexlerae]